MNFLNTMKRQRTYYIFCIQKIMQIYYQTLEYSTFFSRAIFCYNKTILIYCQGNLFLFNFRESSFLNRNAINAKTFLMKCCNFLVFFVCLFFLFFYFVLHIIAFLIYFYYFNFCCSL